MKKKLVSDLKPGTKVLYERTLCVVDTEHCLICLSNGKIDYGLDFKVTPVKVQIRRV